MNYEEAVAYIEETPKFTTKNKLEHTKECLRRLGSPEERFNVIHVAGTNGKGSTCAFLTSILREAGYLLLRILLRSMSDFRSMKKILKMILFCMPLKK